jgi:hypothetical protein
MKPSIGHPLTLALSRREREVRYCHQLIAVVTAVRPLVESWHHIRQNSAPEWSQPSSRGR